MRRFAVVILGLSLCVSTAFATSSTSSSSMAATTSPFQTKKLESNIYYVKIPKFTVANANKARAALKKIADAKPRGVILDLRNNQGGAFDMVREIVQAFVANKTPYLRHFQTYFKSLEVTDDTPLFLQKMPIVLLRDQGTVNEPDIIIYVLEDIRKAGIVEFSPHRSALMKIYKEKAGMQSYFPIKEGSFYRVPDSRVIADEGADQNDVVPAAVRLVREMSPWDEVQSSSSSSINK